VAADSGDGSISADLEGEFMAPRRTAAILAAAAACIVLGPPPADAQGQAPAPVATFDGLTARLKPGATVWVTDAQGREIKGTIREVTPAALTLDGPSPRTFGPEGVRLVQERAGSRVGKSALWGGIAGAAIGTALAAVYQGDEIAQPCSCQVCGQPAGTCGSTSPTTVVHWSAMPLLAGVGAGMGALVGAVLPDRRRDVYRAPARVPEARLTIAPVVTPHARGLRVAYSF
jgi:hypothetical protein